MEDKAFERFISTYGGKICQRLCSSLVSCCKLLEVQQITIVRKEHHLLRVTAGEGFEPSTYCSRDSRATTALPGKDMLSIQDAAGDVKEDA